MSYVVLTLMFKESKITKYTFLTYTKNQDLVTYQLKIKRPWVMGIKKGTCYDDH